MVAAAFVRSAALLSASSAANEEAASPNTTRASTSFFMISLSKAEFFLEREHLILGSYSVERTYFSANSRQTIADIGSCGPLTTWPSGDCRWQVFREVVVQNFLQRLKAGN